MFVIDVGWYFAHYADNAHFPKYWRWPFAVDLHPMQLLPLLHGLWCNVSLCFGNNCD